ncbi:hypothetical protein DIS24_g11342 [Lasiodiplodia hormozganensis]|uniref:ATPase AAA-type core domain-containing protein n=1 Tax=Lasiodiplodia hormozganensis TaxID=869390 RepID=A0AA40C283_9PEZI|nr:hypothetical protein DIS24_g11342 [Lasiodiplodia hormozganensis]
MATDQHATTPNGDSNTDSEDSKAPSKPLNPDTGRSTASTVPPDAVPSMNVTNGENTPPEDDRISEASAYDEPDHPEDMRGFVSQYHDTKERTFDLLERINKRDIRRRQHNRYMLLLDDRIEYIEKELQILFGRPDLEELKRKLQPEPAPDSASTPAVDSEKRHYPTGLKTMSWKEYAKTKGDSGTFKDPIPKSAIDILEEEPTVYQPQQHWFRYMKSYQEDSAAVPSPPKSAEGAPSRTSNGSLQAKSMPERIRINCPDLCDALREFAPEGTLSHPDAKHIVMRRPFKFITHNEQLLRNFTAQKERDLSENSVVDVDSTSTNPQAGEQSAKGEESTEERRVKHLRLLQDFISDYITPAKERASKRDRIAFQDLHFLFEPGQIVYVRHKEHPQKTWRVLQVAGGNRYLRKHDPRDEEAYGCKSDKRDTFSPFVLDCYFLAFDGVRFRRVYHRFSIPFFSDDQPTKRFWVLPLEIAINNELLDKDLIRSQGQQYLECTTICHRYYHGRTLEKDSQGARLRARGESGVDVQIFSESIDGNVMIDFDKAYQQNQNWMLNFEDLTEYKINPREWESSIDPRKETIQGDFVIDSRRKEEYLDREEDSERLESWETRKLREDDLLVLPDRVPAFILRSRKWVYVQLGRNAEGEEVLTKVEKRREAWDELQLPGEEHLEPDEENRSSHKYIIQSLVAKHFAKDMNLDLVRNKGDLGLDPQQVEVNLTKHFELAQSWDCILLLDEADVFLAARSLRDLNRNALVSVFLRILEYYEGILFLTTNKVGLIDEAFKSRIHMALYYPWLTEEQTVSIWRSLLKKAGSSQQGLIFDKTDIMAYARKLFNLQSRSEHGRGPEGIAPGWNGRQIKNGFMSAIALAQYEAKRKRQLEKDETPIQIYLKPQHFETVVKASEAFDQYLWKVHNYTADSKLAEKGGYRIDGHGPGFNGQNASSYPARPTSLDQQPSAYQYQPNLPPSQPQPILRISRVYRSTIHKARISTLCQARDSLRDRTISNKFRSKITSNSIYHRTISSSHSSCLSHHRHRNISSSNHKTFQIMLSSSTAHPRWYKQFQNVMHMAFSITPCSLHTTMLMPLES